MNFIFVKLTAYFSHIYSIVKHIYYEKLTTLEHLNDIKAEINALKINVEMLKNQNQFFESEIIRLNEKLKK